MDEVNDLSSEDTKELEERRILCKLSDHVKEQYMRNRHIPPDTLHASKPCLKHFTDVQLVKHPVPCGEKEIFDLAVIMRNGLVQNASVQPSTSESQVTIDNSSFTRLKSIFDVLVPNYNSEEYKPEVIMIEGAPGMGKTTLCKEIAYQWAQNQSLTHLKLVLFLSLEKVTCNSIKTLEDLILYFYNFDETTADFAKQCAGILQQRINHNILVILDGYDINQDSCEDSFLTQIIRRKVLRHSKIVITPRDLYASKLQNFADIRIEILGFSDESKKEYIKNEFKNYPNKIEVLSLYLSTNKNINGICYIPMIMDILVQAYNETEELPENETELYQKIICHLIIRYLNKHGEGIQPIECSNLLLQDLPDICKRYLLNLSEVAFNLLKCDKAVFTDEDFKVVNPNIAQYHSIQGLGLLKSTERLQGDNMNLCFFLNFLHSSIQEFLAAYYVTSQNAGNQFELLKNTFFMHKYTNMWIVFVSVYKHAFGDFSNYSAYFSTHHILKSVIGDMKDLDILQSFHKLINECISSSDHEALQFFGFRATETKYYNTLCLKNTADELSLMNKLTVLKVSWNKVYISLYHDSKADMEKTEAFIIDSNMQENVYSRLASDLNENKDLSVMMINVSSMLGYRANQKQFSSGLNINDSITNLVLRDCFLSDEISVMMSSYFEKSKLKVVVFVGCLFSGTGIKNIFNSLGRIATIEIMVIGNMDVNEEASIAVASAIANNSKMFYLEIVNCYLKNEVACRIITALRNISSLGTLLLENNNFSKDTTDDLATAVSVNCRLKKLKLGNNNLQHHAVVLAQALGQVKLLTDLDLRNNNMTDKVVDALALAIENNSSLQRVNLRGNALKTNGIIKIAQSLSWNSMLKVLDICNNQITEDAADAIAIAVLSNTSLEELYLDNNGLALGIKTLSATLKEISTLKVLGLDNNNVSDDAADGLAAVVCNNKNLEKLFLMNNNLNLGAMKIFWALSKITALTVLNLSKNGMTEVVACSLAAAIESNHSLTTIRLSNNKLQTKGIITISQSLRKLSSLQVLHIDDNQITKAAANDIASVVLSNNCHLKELYLDDNDLQDGMFEIANALKNASAIQKLVISSNNFSENVSDALADALKSMHSLKVFAAMNNRLRTKGIISIANSISCLSGITLLNIHNNEITKQAEDALALAIKNNNKIDDLCIGENDFTGARKIITSFKNLRALKKINITNCGMLESVSKELEIGLTNKDSLYSVAFEGNYLKTNGIISVAKSLRCISKITLLNLHNNQLTEEAGDALASIILNNTKLEDLYLGNNQLQMGALKVIRALKRISTLKVLDLSDNNITECAVDELSSTIDCNPLLSILRLRSNKLKTTGAIKIIKSITKLTNLKSLNMRNNQITDGASEAIASMLLSNTKIEELYLGNNYLRGGIIKILTALKTNVELKLLDLDGNNISGSELMSVFNSVTLEKLWLATNSLGMLKSVHIQNLHLKMKLTELDFNDNYLSGNVAKECVSTIISNNSSLESVQLQNNCFNTEELRQILQSLSKLSTLKIFNIKGNIIPLELIDVLALVIRNNAGLEELHLNCDYLQQDISKITGVLKSLPKLKIIDICGGNASEKVVQDLTTVILNQSNYIWSLRLIENNLELSAGVIAQAISNITSLTVLNLSSNSIPEEVANDLAVAITSNQSLKDLKLVNNCLKTSGTVILLQALSNLSKLKLLNLRRNLIDGSQDLVDAMAKVVSSNRRLETVCLGDNNYSNYGIPVVSTLKNISTLVLLYLSNMQLSDDVRLANDLACIIRNNRVLEYFYLANNFLSCSLIPIIEACKEYSKTLKILDLQNNSVDPTSITDLVNNVTEITSLDAVLLSGLTLNSTEMIYSHLMVNQKEEEFESAMSDQSKILEFLTLEVQKNDISTHIKHTVNSFSIPSYCVQNFYIEISDVLHASEPIHNLLVSFTKKRYKLSETDETNLVYFLTILKKLKVIDLELLNIDENAAFELAAAIQCNSNLKQLWLRSNKLYATGALFIFNSLKCISTLKVLDISNNNIGHQLSDNIAAVINSNHMLEQLWLDGNVLLSKGIVRISNALNSLSTLRTLSLCNNGIADDAAGELSTIIANNIYLEDLQLSGNLLTSAGTSTIAKSCKKLLRLRKLDLFNNKICKDAADVLADALSNCYNLQELYLSYNTLETLGAIKILQALKFKCKLQILTLSNNDIGEEVADDLTDVLINNNMFYILLIGGNNLQTTAAVKIANVVRNHNTSMQLFGVCDNNISAHGKDEIVKIFSTATRLRLYV